MNVFWFGKFKKSLADAALANIIDDQFDCPCHQHCLVGDIMLLLLV
jgi:hypothetical protein